MQSDLFSAVPSSFEDTAATTFALLLIAWPLGYTCKLLVHLVLIMLSYAEVLGSLLIPEDQTNIVGSFDVKLTGVMCRENCCIFVVWGNVLGKRSEPFGER